ncbi:hypothetical protein A0H81_01396 [Grifola frondosa]|uniref:Rab-GAP TBC domain-containing protein n=1 Tax=Grifola frondosa TaxID=5627 RepID=A0A1C7MS61_GRIFR|nr:hypothetical protein A0H81_01396 [Grifola frondosa]
MDSPSFIVIPPTPISTPAPSQRSSRIPQPGCLPELTPSTSQNERSSSETTIVTIYSMYEEDAGSWSAAGPLVSRRSPKDDVAIAGSNASFRESYIQADELEDSAYYDTTYDPHMSKRHSAMDKSRHSVLSNGSVQLAYSDRPLSGLSEQVSVQRRSRPPSIHRRKSHSSQRNSGILHSDSRPLSSSTSGTPLSSPLPLLPTSPPPEFLLQVPPNPTASSSSNPRRQAPSVISAAESNHSLLPSEGEDPDAFHVRSTYAQLETCGVKGDGYEEGWSDAGRGMLASLDRYGFYSIPSHDRLILMPAAPLQKPLTRIATAGPSGPASPPPLPRQPQSPPPVKESLRTEKWGRMLEAQSRDPGGNVDSWGIRPAKEHKLHRRVFKGIPDCWRTAAWEVLMNRFSKTGRSEMRKLAQEYREALDRPSTYDVQIDLDVPRTISGHVMFRTRYGQGQRSLFHVLHCLSLRCETCGYCQGMGPLAATLLCYFDPERVYASLVRIHDSYAMHTIFSPGFPGLLEAIYVQERITEQMLPAVYAAFKKHMVSTTSYATKWYITLFANSVPFQTQLRLWDAFLLEGHDIFVIVAVAIVWVYRDHITSESANFETVLSLLSSFFVLEDEDALLAWIEKVALDKKLRSDMQQWRADWKRLVAAGTHNQALL